MCGRNELYPHSACSQPTAAVVTVVTAQRRTQAPGLDGLVSSSEWLRPFVLMETLRLHHLLQDRRGMLTQTVWPRDLHSLLHCNFSLQTSHWRSSVGPPGIMPLMSAHLPSPCPVPPGPALAHSRSPWKECPHLLPADPLHSCGAHQRVHPTGLAPYLVSPARWACVLPTGTDSRPEAPPGRGTAFPGCGLHLAHPLHCLMFPTVLGRHRRQGCHPDSHVRKPRPGVSGPSPKSHNW